MNILFVFWGIKGGGALYSYNICKQISLKIPNGRFFISISKKNVYYDNFNTLNARFFYIDGVHSVFGLLMYHLYKKRHLKNRLVSFLKDNQIDTIVLGMNHMISDVLVDAAKNCGTNLIPVIHEPTVHIGEFFLSKLYKNIKRDKLINNATGIVTLTEFVKNELVEKHCISKEKFKVIKHGNFSYYKASQCKTIHESNKINLLFFGRIEYYKGLDILIEAFNIVGVTDKRLRLNIYGKGKIGKFNMIEEVQDRITIYNDWVKEEKVVEIFKEAHICILPYRKASQSGIVGIAIESGVPIITTPVPGIIEQVYNSGALVTKGFSKNEIANTIRRLVNNPDLYQKLSQKNIDSNSNDDWKEIAEELYSFCVQ